MASTTNPKEYIQRRGRVLRKAPNKPYAVIYDFVTLPRPLDSVSSLTTEQAQRDLTLVKNELARIKEFGRLSQNSMDANNLIWDIQEAYHITDEESEKVVSSMEQIEINEKAVERLKRKIILQENQNLKTRAMTDQQMVAWIKKQIEEEAQCYSNR